MYVSNERETLLQPLEAYLVGWSLVSVHFGTAPEINAAGESLIGVTNSPQIPTDLSSAQPPIVTYVLLIIFLKYTHMH